jgi:hypothetical protein
MSETFEPSQCVSEALSLRPLHLRPPNVCAPKKTPAGIIEMVNKEINNAIADPKIKAQLEDLSLRIIFTRNTIAPIHDGAEGVEDQRLDVGHRQSASVPRPHEARRENSGTG